MDDSTQRRIGRAMSELESIIDLLTQEIVELEADKDKMQDEIDSLKSQNDDLERSISYLDIR